MCVREFSFFSNPYSEFLLVILNIASYYEKQTSTKFHKLESKNNNIFLTVLLLLLLDRKKYCSMS